MIRTLSQTLDDVKITKDQDHHLCVPCLEKRSRKYNKGPSQRAKEFLELIHSDLCGPFPIQSITGSRYFMIFVDDKTRYTWVYFLKSKHHDETLQVFKDFKTLIEKQSNHQIKRFWCDNAKGEYNNQYFTRYLADNGISYEPSARYASNQNGVSERMIGKISAKTRSLLIDAYLSEGFWEETVRSAVYLGNRCPSRSLPLGMTPYKARLDTNPSLKHLRRIGCDCYVQIHPDLYKKWRTKLLHCTLLGYVENTTKQYRVWHREGRRLLIVASQDVDFDEDSFANRIPQSTPEAHTDEKQSVLDFLQALTNPGDKPEPQSHGVSFTDQQSSSVSSTDQQSSRVTSTDQQASMTIEPLSQVETQQPESPLETQVPLRRSTRERVPLPQSFKLRSALSARVLNSVEPASYNDALKHQNAVHWKKAIEEELHSLDLNKTWDLVDENTLLRSGRELLVANGYLNKNVMLMAQSVTRHGL